MYCICYDQKVRKKLKNFKIIGKAEDLKKKKKKRKIYRYIRRLGRSVITTGFEQSRFKARQKGGAVETYLKYCGTYLICGMQTCMGPFKCYATLFS